MELGINVDEMKNYGYELVIKDIENDELKVIKKQAPSYYVAPCEKEVGESDYRYTSLCGCFNVRKTIKPGEKYQVEVLKEACLTKEGDRYMVSEKGELSLMEI